MVATTAQDNVKAAGKAIHNFMQLPPATARLIATNLADSVVAEIAAGATAARVSDLVNDYLSKTDKASADVG